MRDEGETENCATLTAPTLHLSLVPRNHIKRQVQKEDPSTLCQDGRRACYSWVSRAALEWNPERRCAEDHTCSPVEHTVRGLACGGALVTLDTVPLPLRLLEVRHQRRHLARPSPQLGPGPQVLMVPVF